MVKRKRTLRDDHSPHYAFPGPMIRGLLRKYWDSAEAKMTSRQGRYLLALVSSMTLRLIYHKRCAVSWRDDAWEYRWPDATIISPGILFSKARPEDWGSLPGATIQDTFLWEYLPENGDVIFDVGAGFGTELLTFSRLVGPTGKVYAFEAHPKTFSLLKRVYTLNHLSNVEPVEAAVTDESGWTTMSDDGDSLSRSVIGSTTLRVPSITIDEFVASRGVSHIDFLKMNIEGAERLAVLGITDAAKLVDHVCISCHDFLGDPKKKTKDEIRQWLTDQGFSVSEQPNSPWLSVRDFLYGKSEFRSPSVHPRGET